MFKVKSKADDNSCRALGAALINKTLICESSAYLYIMQQLIHTHTHTYGIIYSARTAARLPIRTRIYRQVRGILLAAATAGEPRSIQRTQLHATRRIPGDAHTHTKICNLLSRRDLPGTRASTIASRARRRAFVRRSLTPYMRSRERVRKESALYEVVCPAVYVSRAMGLAPYELTARGQADGQARLAPSRLNCLYSLFWTSLYSYIVVTSLIRFSGSKRDKPVLGVTETGKEFGRVQKVRSFYADDLSCCRSRCTPAREQRVRAELNSIANARWPSADEH
ncbi:unnamed protein product, partial [Trichogramma brassicae]